MSTFLEKHPEVLNLGGDEVKVYGFLNQEGESLARVIADRCMVPYSRIHKVLYRLQQQELVISWGEAPKLFALRFKDPELVKRFAQKAESAEELRGGQL